MTTPEKNNRNAVRLVATISLVAIVATAAALRFNRFAESTLFENPSSETELAQADQSHEPEEATGSVAHPAGKSEQTVTKSPENGGIDLSQSSWIDPFDDYFWDSAGWEFNQHEMISKQPNALAMFRRPYQNVMFSCTIHSGTGAENLRIVIHPTEPNSPQYAIIVDPLRVALVEEREGTETDLANHTMSKDFFESGKAQLRFVITGNRLLIGCNEAIVINTSRPAGFSSSSLHVGLFAKQVGVRIEKLRIEGD